MSDYYESAEGIMISRERALFELKSHGLHFEEDLKDFFKELGDKNIYSAQDVLDFLGY